MKYGGSAPARQTSPGTAEQEFRALPRPEEVSQGNGNAVVHLQLLWVHRRMLAYSVLCGLLVGTLLAFLIPARYESTARLMPPDNAPTGGLAMAAAAFSSNSTGGLGSIAGDLLGLKSTSDMFVGILTSRSVQDQLIQQFDLKKLYGDRRMEDARRDLAERTTISVDRKSQIITLIVADRDPKRAASLAQSYVAELNRLVAELSTSSARRERLFLEERLKAVNQDLEMAEKDFSQFASKNAAIDIKEQGRAMVEAAATLQGQLIAAQSELEGLKQIYTDNNVRVRSVKARIGELRHQLEKIGGKGESAAAAQGHEEDSLYPSIRKLPLLGVTYADLYRRMRVQEAVFEALTKQYELAKVQEVKEIPTVKVLDAANIPEKKSFPPRSLIVFLGMTLAFAASATWLYAQTRWNQTASDDPRKLLASEVIATVRAAIPGFSQNGAGENSGTAKFRRWFRRRSQDAAQD